jgi:acetyl esterase
MPLDPKAQALLDARSALGNPPYRTMTVAAARAMTIQQSAALNKRRVAVADVADRTIPGPAGPLRARVYTPAGDGPFPLVVYFHGGGFVICDLGTHDGLCRALCKASGCVVLSVDYRLAPEHPFPAPALDAEAATLWALEHAPEVGGDPSRVAVAGDSAGGCLAAVACLRLRDAGQPLPRGQALLYPITTCHPDTTPSYRSFASGYGLTRDSMLWFLSHYLPDPAHADDPSASPLLAHDLTGLPPALVITAEYDLLRDEAARFADRLRASGVPTKTLHVDGMIHGFLRYVGILDQAQRGIDAVAGWLGGLWQRQDHRVG